MVTLFVITLALLSILCAIRGYLLSSKKHEYGSYLSKMYFLGSISAIVQECIFLLPHDIISLFFITANEMFLIAWFLFVSKFLFIFLNTEKIYRKIFKYVYILSLIDYLCLVYSIIIKKNSAIFYAVFGDASKTPGAPEWLFYLYHLGIVILISIIIVSIILYKISKERSIYRNQYIILLVEFLLVISISVIYLTAGLNIDITVFIYMMFIMEIDIFSIYYIPRKTTYFLNNTIIKRMKDGILIFDNDNHFVTANESVKDKYTKEKRKMERDTFKSIFDKYNLYDKDYYSWDNEIITNGKKKYFNFEFSRITDKKQGSIGSYIIGHDRTEEVEKNKKEQWKLSHDQLTKLYTKETFAIKAQNILESSSDDYYIIYTDIKNFKLVNDYYGRIKGDQILIDIANSIKEVCQKFKNCICCRLNGDNFVILVNENDFEKLNIRKRMNDINTSLDHNMKLYTYFGVYKIEDKSMSISHMIDNAHIALIDIKKSYKNFVGFYKNDLKDNLYVEQQLISKFPNALKNKEFKMYLQPQISKEGKLLGAEALVRWIQDGKVISPKEFIPVFERSGLISMLDKYIWEEACKTLAKWNDPKKYISINISIDDFNSMNVLKELQLLINKYKIDIHCLKLEITESLFEDDQERFIQTIDELKSAGFIVEMDDFGSGYSSLNLLKNINIDVIKMDMGFLYATGSDEKSKIILSTLIDLSKKIGLQVVTEGVETKEQYDYLCEYGCDVFQGYYFSRPISVEDFERKYIGEANEK